MSDDSFDLDKEVDKLLPRARETIKGLSLWKFLDPKGPWVLVKDGSFAGMFDWVPESYRIGPWTNFAICFLTALWYIVALSAAWFLSDASKPWWSVELSTIEYPSFGSAIWLWNAACFLYFLFLVKVVSKNFTRMGKWVTYTVQSFTLMTFRHGLVVASPWSQRAKLLAEILRFPLACSQSIIFVVFNFFLLPIGYFFIFRNPVHKKRFIKFCFSFRLINLHMLNIVFCILNCGSWTSTARRLDPIDFYLAVLSSCFYMAIYLLLFDRLGVHLYPPFSPRTGPVVVCTTWTLNLLCYWFAFKAWQYFLLPQENMNTEVPDL